MSNPSTITRTEIAVLLGIHLSKLVSIINHSDVELPKPLGKDGKQLIYDREIMQAWIATNPLENFTWQQQSAKNASKVEQTAALCRDFLSGELGASKAQSRRKAFRLLAAKHAPRQTQCVEIRGGAYDGFGERRGPKPKQQAAQ